MIAELRAQGNGAPREPTVISDEPVNPDSIRPTGEPPIADEREDGAPRLLDGRPTPRSAPLELARELPSGDPSAGAIAGTLLGLCSELALGVRTLLASVRLKKNKDPDFII